MARHREVLRLLLVVSCFAIASSRDSCAPAAGPPRFRECRLQYYVQVEVGVVGVNENFLPSLNASYSGPFGNGELFVFNVTEGRSRRSRQVGRVRGVTINSAFTAEGFDLIEVEFIAYNDGYYKGTIQIQGEILALPDAPNEVAIVGGTGSFRGARGYALIARLLVHGPYRLFHHDLHFMH